MDILTYKRKLAQVLLDTLPLGPAAQKQEIRGREGNRLMNRKRKRKWMRKGNRIKKRKRSRKGNGEKQIN